MGHPAGWRRRKARPPAVSVVAGNGNSGNGHTVIPEGGLDLERHIQQTERAYIVAALEASGGTGTRAAELLKMTYRSFRHYVKKYGIN